MDDDPVTRWIEGLKAGDERAVAELWNHYFERLVQFARRRLGDSPRRVADEEDVAVSVFRCLCAGAAHGRLAEMSDRGDLWRVLVTMTARKTIDQQRRMGGKKRGGGKVRGESVFVRKSGEEVRGGLQQFGDATFTPQVIAILEEEGQRLLAALENETLKQVALWKLEGFTNDEIARKLELTTRSVERKLQRIREKWAQVTCT
ncbi:MAG: RNA polymerase subunit sigma-70 [Planctomycetes bacterium]|nr:RNA polymerase subunit sigma-70 [Planctomycetota bacterium]